MSQPVIHPAAGCRVGDPHDSPTDAALLGLACDVHSVVAQLRDARDHLPPSLALVVMIIDQTLQLSAARLAHADRADLPHLGRLAIQPTRHGTAREVVFHADPALLDRITAAQRAPMPATPETTR